ncbi:hypothetical protein RND81_01G114100 [Saponaria officinalis]|uniref:Uncharacterized protein n=2 Tax=Saponaria officinalis TaxID=3572 RepID=A0AAW1NE87_SAPOF
MDHPRETFIIPQIQINLVPKHESSSSSSSSKLLINPRIHVDFAVKTLTLACSPSNDDNGGRWVFLINENEQPVTFPTTMGLILHDNFGYKETIWMALTYLGVEERFFDQVVETLEVKVGQVFTDLSHCVVEPGFGIEFQVHVNVLIYRVSGRTDGSTQLKVEDEDNDVLGWAARDWPVEWLE